MNMSIKKYALSALTLVACAQSMIASAAETIPATQAASTTQLVLTGLVEKMMEAIKLANPGRGVLGSIAIFPIIAGISHILARHRADLIGSSGYSRQLKIFNPKENNRNKQDNTTQDQEDVQTKYKTRPLAQNILDAMLFPAGVVSGLALMYTLSRYSIALKAIEADIDIVKNAAIAANAAKVAAAVASTATSPVKILAPGCYELHSV